MRFIRGDSLKDGHRRASTGPTARGRDPGERALAAARAAAAGSSTSATRSAYAHSRGVLHRDLKPGNIMLGKYGETLVVDWGLAKAVGRRRRRRAGDVDERTLAPSRAATCESTELGARLGTPAYMSPEQAAGRLDELGPASDVYSLGATLYCLLTGQAAVRRAATSASCSARSSGASSRPRASVNAGSTRRWRRSA